jgi:exosortase/archaeosortase family protein
LLRFALGFALLETLVYLVLWRNALFAPYARVSANLTALFFGPWIDGVRAMDTALVSSQFSIQVRPGCDSYQASAVLLAGIAAFPAPLARKLTGALLGVALLFALNVLRLGTILLVGIHRRELFDRMHLEILPGVFLFAALGLWLAWTSWVRPVPAR